MIIQRAITGRAALVVAAVVVVTAWPAAASAQNFFESFFGSFHRQFSAPSLPERSQAFADPRAAPAEAPSAGSGRSVGFCVRLCDGRYFPIQHHVAATPVQLCGALCPASKTKVFSGSEIKGAVANDGTRYADLDNSFLFRERLVPNCTCNGKDAFGLAPLDVSADPTLRPGDVVATNDGLKTFTGAKTKRGTQTAEFTPVEKPARKPATIGPAPAR
jgi:hypothetical protein